MSAPEWIRYTAHNLAPFEEGNECHASQWVVVWCFSDKRGFSAPLFASVVVAAGEGVDWSWVEVATERK